MLQVVFLLLNINSIVGGARSFFCFEDFNQKSLNVPMVVTHVPIFCNIDLKSLVWTLSTTLSARSSTLFIMLFDVVEQNIQTREQKLRFH